MNLQNKVVVVTGGGNGIGQQLVLNLLRIGAKVAAVDISADALKNTEGAAGVLGHNLTLHQVDISNRRAVFELAEQVIAKYGCVDAIINNAGIIHPFKPVVDLDCSVIEKMINVNFYGVVNMTKAFLPLLLKRPVAHMANVSSMGGLLAFPNQTFYGASKAAVKLLSEGLYAELKNTNVGVTVIFPGAINTNITRNCEAHTEKLERASQIYQGTQPDVAARRIISAIEKNKFSLTIGIDAKIFITLYRIFPSLTISLVEKIMRFAV